MPQRVGMYENCCTDEEVAEMTGYTVGTIRYNHRRFGIPSILIAGRVWFLEEDVKEWLHKKQFEENEHRRREARAA